MLFYIFKKSRIFNHPVFYHLNHTRSYFRFWQCLEGIGINKNTPWLVETSYHIFAPRMIDSNLTSDAAVNLCQQCSRDLNKRNASHKCRSDKTCQIPQHATP